MPDLSINVQALSPKRALITLQGSLNAHTFEQLDAIVNQLFKRKIYEIIVNLAQIEYISSAGAGVFIGALVTAQENGGEMVLAQPQKKILEIFELLGLTQIFTIADDNETAKKKFA